MENILYLWENYGFWNFYTSNNHLNTGFCRKHQLKCIHTALIKNFKIRNLPVFHLPACCKTWSHHLWLHLGVRQAGVWLQNFCTINKGNVINHIGLLVLMNVFPLLHNSFYPLLLSSLCLQIAYSIDRNIYAYRKVRNLQIGVDKLVKKVSINLLYAAHSQLLVCIISTIIYAPTGCLHPCRNLKK